MGGIFHRKHSDYYYIRFEGRELGSVETSPIPGHRYFSGEEGRYTRMNLYKTIDGDYACELEHLSKNHGEANYRHADYCATREEVVDFFGMGELARRLYYWVWTYFC